MKKLLYGLLILIAILAAAYSCMNMIWSGMCGNQICIDENKNYTYYIKEDGQLKSLTSNVWDFDLKNGESRIGLNKFDYWIGSKKYIKVPYYISALVLYSHAKRSIIIRMDADDHFQDFVKVDSLCAARN
jgi:hypothetical protein